MKRTVNVPGVLWTALLILSSTMLLAQQPMGQNAPPADNQNIPTADNANANQHDHKTNDIADQGRNSRSDHDLTQDIRNAIHEDTTLSSDAQKVKVESQNGQVKLKGTVQSEQEKQAIESKAEALAGQGKVTSELTVKPAT